MSEFRDKLKKGILWELFWQYIGMSMIGIALVIYGIWNPAEHSAFNQIWIVIIGIFIAAAGIRLTKKYYRKM